MAEAWAEPHLNNLWIKVKHKLIPQNDENGEKLASSQLVI